MGGMYIQITLSIIRIRIFPGSKKNKIFCQTKTVYLLLKFLSQYIPADFYSLIFQKLHGINRCFIWFLCSQSSHGQNSFSIIRILETSRKISFSQDFLPVDQIVEDNRSVCTFRIYMYQRSFHFTGYCKYPVEIHITISIQKSVVSCIFIVYMKKRKFPSGTDMIMNEICRTTFQISYCHIVILL